MAAVPFERIDAGAPKIAHGDPILIVDDIVKRFETPDGVLTAVDHVSLSVAPGEFVGVIGPSGCGKSTLFNVIGGLLDGYEGTVKVAGERVRGPHRAVGMIFQEESTFPWRNVIDNSSASTGSSGAIRRSCRAVCGSGCRWRARWRRNPRSC